MQASSHSQYFHFKGWQKNISSSNLTFCYTKIVETTSFFSVSFPVSKHEKERIKKDLSLLQVLLTLHPVIYSIIYLCNVL